MIIFGDGARDSFTTGQTLLSFPVLREFWKLAQLTSKGKRRSRKEKWCLARAFVQLFSSSYPTIETRRRRHPTTIFCCFGFCSRVSNKHHFPNVGNRNTPLPIAALNKKIHSEPPKTSNRQTILSLQARFASVSVPESEYKTK